MQRRGGGVRTSRYSMGGTDGARDAHGRQRPHPQRGATSITSPPVLSKFMVMS